MLRGIWYESTNIISPQIKIIPCESKTSFLTVDLKKPPTKEERIAAIAQSNESAVEVIAAIRAHIARTTGAPDATF